VSSYVLYRRRRNADGVCSVLQESETQVLSKEAIDKFTMVALPACLNLVDTLPETVYRVCDLLMTITKRNGEVWRDEMLDTLVADVSVFFNNSKTYVT
jgi:hypothetical protein